MCVLHYYDGQFICVRLPVVILCLVYFFFVIVWVIIWLSVPVQLITLPGKTCPK